jgi:hypothetical protein
MAGVREKFPSPIVKIFLQNHTVSLLSHLPASSGFRKHRSNAVFCSAENAGRIAA